MSGCSECARGKVAGCWRCGSRQVMPLLQDEAEGRGLSRALASKPDARLHAREAAAAVACQWPTCPCALFPAELCGRGRDHG